jgi:elongation factor G
VVALLELPPFRNHQVFRAYRRQELQQRRAIITSQELRGNTTVLDAEAPLSAMFGYSMAVRSLSQGRASFSMEPLKYGRAPDGAQASLF